MLEDLEIPRCLKHRKYLEDRVTTLRSEIYPMQSESPQ